jgi:ribosome-associated heat shock protein Hsp15
MNYKTEENIRVDKWLWAVRLYKTRSLATDACDNGRVSILGMRVKPSRNLKIGDIIEVKVPPIIRTYKVKGLLAQRLSATLVKEFIEDITPPDQLKILEDNRWQHTVYRDPGEGRPTKKDRRDIDKILDIRG